MTTHCAVDDCSRPIKTRGLCDPHYQRFRIYGDPAYPPQKMGRARRDDIGYFAAHARLRTDMGPASSHSCVACGEPARHWSYLGNAPDEKIQDGLRYSLDPAYYAPKCQFCHFSVDRAVYRQCSVEGCEGKHLAKDLCRKHYLRQWKAARLTIEYTA